MPRSSTHSPSPYRKFEKSSRKVKRSVTSSRDMSPTDGSRSYRTSERSRRRSSDRHRHRRSRSRSSSLKRHNSRSTSKHQSSGSSSKYYSSKRRSRSRDSAYRDRQSSKTSSSELRKQRASSSRSSTVFRSSSSSSSSSSQNDNKYIPLSKENDAKTAKMITPPPPPANIFTSVNLLNEMVMPETFDQINADEFVAKTFTSSKKVSEKVVIDLRSDTISLPKIEIIEEEDTIFHPNLFGDGAVRMEKWVKKLFNYRQKMFLGN